MQHDFPTCSNPPLPLAIETIEKESFILILIDSKVRGVQDTLNRVITRGEARVTLVGARYKYEIEGTLPPQAVFEHHAK